MQMTGDLRQFYLTPVDITTPYEALRTMELPKNLHVQQDYHRFHPGEGDLCLIREITRYHLATMRLRSAVKFIATPFPGRASDRNVS